MIPLAPSEISQEQKVNASERGIGILEIVIVIAVVAIVVTFSVIGISRAREDMRLANSAKEVAGYLEKARINAVRRHDTSSVQISGKGTSTFSVTMDFSG